MNSNAHVSFSSRALRELNGKSIFVQVVSLLLSLASQTKMVSLKNEARFSALVSCNPSLLPHFNTQ